MDFYLYINYGSGYVLLTSYDVNIDLFFEIDENINESVKRLNTSGNFKLYGTEAETANTYFIINGNDSAPFRIYENGISGVGTLKFDGFVNIKAFYNLRETLITLESFKPDDAYSNLLAVINDESQFQESMSLGGIDIDRFYSQGLHTNCNKLQGYTLSGSNYVTTGNALTLTNVGRVAMTAGSAIVVYDNITREIRRYSYSAPNWSLSTLGTSYDCITNIGNNCGNGAVCFITNVQIAFIEDYHSQLMFMTAVTGTWSVNASKIIEDISMPSLAMITNVGSTLVALADNGTKMLRAYNTSCYNIGNSLSLGDVENPTICTLDAGANNRIALLDSKSNTIRCYTFDGSDFTELGSSLKISASYEPQISYESPNNIIVVDAISGKLERYAFSGTAWSETGTGASISGGYMGACAKESSVIGVIQTDNYSFNCSRTNDYKSILDEVLFDATSGSLSIASASGADFNLDNICIGELSNLTPLNSDPRPNNYTRFTLKELLDLPKLWQNYWYIDGSNIKFRQPNEFSSTGTNFDISSLTRGGLSVPDENNERTYTDEFNISKEKLKFPNERNEEFIGLPVDYERNNENELEYPFNFTTDFNFIVDFFTNQKQNLSKSGLFLAYITSDGDGFSHIPSGAGEISGNNTRNNYLSKSYIMENHWKDYRYSNIKNFLLNGNSVPVQDTVRNMIEFPDIQLSYEDLSITEFPASVGSLTWDTGVVSYITRFSVNLVSKIVTIKSRLLDL